MNFLSLLLITFAITLTACGDQAAFGGGGLPAPKADERELDLSGTDDPVDMPTADEAAMTAVGVTRIVEATAEIADEVGDALGDLFPTEDNPCPGGGSASSSLSGSFNHPRVRMEFHQCIRGEVTLDGKANIRCNDLDGSDCKEGDVTIGEDPAVLLLRRDSADNSYFILMRGLATVTNDKGAGHVHVVANLQGETRSLTDDGPRYSFITQSLNVNLQDLPEGQTELRIDGVAGLGGGAKNANCISGRFDTETATEPLILQDRIIRSGRLQLHSPPPRPGTQQAEAAYVEGGASVLGADGVQQVYTAEQMAGFCSLR